MLAVPSTFSPPTEAPFPLPLEPTPALELLLLLLLLPLLNLLDPKPPSKLTPPDASATVMVMGLPP
jgi:hypothetical protein